MNNKTAPNAEQGSSFFSGKSIGKNLREVAVDTIKTESEDVVSRWYHAPSTDLFTWVDRGNNIIKQQLHYNGQVVEWNCLEGLKTGVVIEADMGIKPTYNAEGRMEPARTSETIKFDNRPMVPCVDLALEILVNCQEDVVARKQIISNFKDPQNISTMKPEDFVQRFGAALKDRTNALDMGLIQSIKNRLRNIVKK